ncbi:hypothetical protein FB451DRAFT_743293 [Mycena latifolia]|nr:hypothetical protein FB451DRAFT_743293 [Mycena latifolia]
MYADDIPSVERSPKVTRSGMDTNDEEGTILVNSTPTPSNSGSSQSQSQPRQSQPHSQSQSQDPTYGESDDYSLYNAHQPEEDDRILPPAPDSGSQDSTQYPSSELSSSYRRLYEPLTPALESTQILEPTQPIDESTQIMEATQLVEERSDSLISFKPEGVLRGDTFSNATSTAGHAKTLLDSLDPSKRNRYAGHLAQVSRVDRDPADASVTNYSSSAARGGYLALPDARPPHWSAGNSKPSTSSATRLRRALVDERTEVIPDSEPPREGSLSPVPPLKPSTRSPPKPRPRPASSDTETDTEIIPDSMDVDGADRNEVVGILNAKSTLMREEEEEEEEEEEVPLSKRTGGKHADLKGKGKAVDMGPPPIKPKVSFGFYDGQNDAC